jgi:hypothetical protein
MANLRGSFQSWLCCSNVTKALWVTNTLLDNARIMIVKLSDWAPFSSVASNQWQRRSNLWKVLNCNIGARSDGSGMFRFRAQSIEQRIWFKQRPYGWAIVTNCWPAQKYMTQTCLKISGKTDKSLMLFLYLPCRWSTLIDAADAAPYIVWQWTTRAWLRIPYKTMV